MDDRRQAKPGPQAEPSAGGEHATEGCGLGEVGLGTVKDGKTARQMVDWARKYGIQSTIHTGGP